MFTFNMPSFSPSQADILKLVNDNRAPVIPHLRMIGRLIVGAARRQVGKNTGELSRSIHYDIRRFGGLPEVWVGTYNSIAYIHHEGTRPHAISARNKTYLRYSSKGRIAYARTVIHPGTKPNRFLTDNLYLARI